MRKQKLFMATAACMAMMVVTGCGSNQENSQTEISQTENSQAESSQTESSRTENSVSSESVQPDSEKSAEGNFSCALFSITMPTELAGTYEVETGENTITVFDKESKDANMGGIVFHVSAFQEPSEYAGGLAQKIGEMTSGDGTLYDICISYASDVQYDIVKYQNGAPENYRKLYDGAEDIAKTLVSTDGGAFVFGKGTKGEELYGDILEMHRRAINEKWDAEKLEEQEMSTIYVMMGDDAAKNVGYIYYDVNGDGVDELLIGENAEGEWKGIVYDLYTMADRKPVHVLSGWDRSRYFVLDNGFLCNEYSSGAAESGWIIYDIVSNSSEISAMMGFKYDAYTDENNPWFISYNVADEEWEKVTEDEFQETKSRFENYERFEYTPLFS